MMFGTREVFEYFSCSACDTLQIVNVLEGEDLMRHYPATYYSHNGSGQPSALQWLVTQRAAGNWTAAEGYSERLCRDRYQRASSGCSWVGMP
ncbi:Possible methyltransferase [Mycobacteroides abscessus]|nr:Possible methyltransferase [Mycobacteroides abscessus]